MASRAALHQMRVIFNPYNKEQIQEILQMRLGELRLDFMDDFSRRLIANKAASVAGDLRAALKICQQVIELYRNHQEEVVAALLTVETANKKGNKKQRTESVSSTASTTQPSVAVAELDVSAQRRVMQGLISEAVKTYKESPFIASVTRSNQLDKAVLIVLTKFRRQGASTGEMCLSILHEKQVFY